MMTPDLLPAAILAYFGWMSVPYSMYWMHYDWMEFWRIGAGGQS